MNLPQSFLNFIGAIARQFHKPQPSTWSNLMTTPPKPVAASAAPALTRDEKVAVGQAALRKFADAHGVLAAHALTDDILHEAAGVVMDAVATAEHGKVI